jgi:spore maturation protein CgeB
LQNKINYYDTHESERRTIVEAGQKKVLAEMTSDKTWIKAFKHFGIIT